jgi:hypothetical protein
MKLEQIQQSIPQSVQTGLNWGSIGATVATIAGWLPSVAALLSIVWLGLQIFVFFKNKNWRKERK